MNQKLIGALIIVAAIMAWNLLPSSAPSPAPAVPADPPAPRLRFPDTIHQPDPIRPQQRPAIDCTVKPSGNAALADFWKRACQ